MSDCYSNSALQRSAINDVKTGPIDEFPHTPERVVSLIDEAEQSRKFAWTAGRVIMRAGLAGELHQLEHDQRKAVLKRISRLLEDLAAQGVLQRRKELQSIGYGSEVGYDYLQSGKRAQPIKPLEVHLSPPE